MNNVYQSIYAQTNLFNDVILLSYFELWIGVTHCFDMPIVDHEKVSTGWIITSWNNAFDTEEFDIISCYPLIDYHIALKNINYSRFKNRWMKGVFVLNNFHISLINLIIIDQL